MPIYKGSNEVSSGNLRKGSTEIQNGYKQTDQFYVNTLAITINFVDAISGATFSTTQFSSIGTPGASFSSFTRTITTDSGRIFNGAITVSEAGDSGNNVNASISNQSSATADLNVSGTYPTQGVTVTLTVNGATQVQLPNLNVSASYSSATFSTSDGGSLGTFSYSTSQSASGGGVCSGGTGNSSGTLSPGGSSYNWSGFQAGDPAGGSFGNGCGVTCTSSVSGSKSGYNSGSNSINQTGTNPSYTSSFTWSPSGGFYGATMESASSAGGVCASCVACQGNAGNPALNYQLVSRQPQVQGGKCYYVNAITCTRDYSAGSGTFNNGDVITNPTSNSLLTLPTGGALNILNPGSFQGSPGSGYISGGSASQNWSNPSGLNLNNSGIGLNYVLTGVDNNGGTCRSSGYSAVNLSGSGSQNGPQSFSTFCQNTGSFSNAYPINMTLTVYYNNDGSVFGSNTYTL